MSDFLIETERLILRPPVMGDFEGWLKLYADPESTRFIGGLQPPAMVWRTFMVMAGAWHMTRESMLSVIEKSSGRWMGRLGPWNPTGWPGTEVGWSLLPEARGKGYATEGAAATMDWAFDNLGWTEIVHTIDPLNQPSQRVAERLGSRILRQAELPPPMNGKLIDVWGQTREEWKARRR